MKTMQQWFDEYAVSHQNKTNQAIHFICVPIIYFSISGLLMCINPSFLQQVIKLNNPLIENWSSIVSIFILLYYLSLSFSVFVKMFIFTVMSLLGNFYLSHVLNLFVCSVILFVTAWIGQFYGHKLEGKKPSFFKDLQFLLIGPPWVFEKMFKKF